MLERTRAQSPFYTAEHEAFRDVMRRFVSREIEPYAHEWDEAGEFPRELYRQGVRDRAARASASRKNMAASPPTSS